MADQASEVKSKTDIVSVIGGYVELKKAGRHFIGRCPFHSEKTPSFTVSPEFQIYKCFGCGEGGDVFDFLQKYEGITFFESLKILAEKVGVVLKNRDSQKDGNKAKLYAANDYAASYYHYVLTKHPLGKQALSYLKEKRGLTDGTIEAFRIGFAPDGFNHLSKFLIEKKSISPQTLVDSGLCYKNSSQKIIDRFRGRVIFPLTNPRGGVIALAGRILPSLAKEGIPKYINSPETEIYHKSQTLFGFYQAREEIKKQGYCLVVEGELDMISPWQAGFKNVVAIKGSALTSEHADFLSRFTNTIYLGLDSDFAGNNAAIKGVVVSENRGLVVKVCEFLGFKDPDEAVAAGIDEFRKMVSSAKPFWDFLFDVYVKRYDPKTSDGAALLVRNLVPFLSQIDEPIIRSRYARKLAELVGSSEEAVISSINRSQQVGSASQGTKTDALEDDAAKNENVNQKTDDRKEALAKQLFISGVMSKPEILAEKIRQGVVFPRPIDRVAGELVSYVEKNTTFTVRDFVESLPPELSESTKNLFLTTNIGEDAGVIFEKTFKEIEKIRLFEERGSLLDRIKNIDTGSENPEFMALQKEIGELTKRIALLDK